MLSTDGEQREFLNVSSLRGSLHDWQNLQRKNKFDCEGKNILIIQPKWNDYKVTAKSKSNTINLAELWYILLFLCYWDLYTRVLQNKMWPMAD